MDWGVQLMWGEGKMGQLVWIDVWRGAATSGWVYGGATMLDLGFGIRV